jgi:DGQHR domain-containing protein
MSERDCVRLPAIEINQGPASTIYSFSVDGKMLPEFTTISRISRDDDSKLLGYQRTESRKHIQEIQRYIESDEAMIPNSIVVAFDDTVTFEPLDDQTEESSHGRHGWLIVPVDKSLPDEQKPGWVVDGQQRLAAIRKAKVDSFPMSVTAFVAKSLHVQREQFILVNSTKSLKRSLIYELLPATESRLPSKFQKKRFSAEILERLNYDEDSPLKGLIRTATNSSGVIKDNSILKMLNNSLRDGVLYHHRDPDTGGGDIEAMLRILKPFWKAISEVFEDAWGLKPRESRLMHGAGVAGMGFLMDAVCDRYRLDDIEFPNEEQFRADLEPLREVCNWTSGYWQLASDDRRKWNEIQNLSKDIHALAGYLLDHYHELVWDRKIAV